MPGVPAAGAGSPPASNFRVILKPTGKQEQQALGDRVTERALLQAIEVYGSVWALKLGRTDALATFRNPEVVQRLLKQSRIKVNGANLTVQPCPCVPATPSAVDEEKLAELFSKPSQKPKNMKISETRDVAKRIPPGVDLDWRVMLSNGSTQTRELLSIEMPYQARPMFTLGGRTTPGTSKQRSVSITPGGSHTQLIKFNNRGGTYEGTFELTLLFNFSNWILEHTFSVHVARPAAVDSMQLLAPERPYVPPPLPDLKVEPTRHTVPALPSSRQCALPGVALYRTTNMEEEGQRELAPYDLPAGISDIVRAEPWSPPHPRALLATPSLATCARV